VPCQHGLVQESVYDAMGGADAVLRLARAWHERVLADEVVSHAFSHGYRDDHDQRLEACFAQALDDAALPGDPRLRRTLTDWFHWGVELMDSHPDTPDDVPDDLPLPRWSWDGPVLS
jgi:truncated hemoglobin YjbI